MSIEDTLSTKMQIETPSLEDFEETIDTTFFEYSYKYQYLILALTVACLAFSVQKLLERVLSMPVLFLFTSVLLYCVSIFIGLKSLKSSLEKLKSFKRLEKFQNKGIRSAPLQRRIEHERQDIWDMHEKSMKYAQYQYALFVTGTVCFAVFLILELTLRTTHEAIRPIIDFVGTIL